MGFNSGFKGLMHIICYYDQICLSFYKNILLCETGQPTWAYKVILDDFLRIHSLILLSRPIWQNSYFTIGGRFLWAGRFGDKVRVGARFSVHPSSPAQVLSQPPGQGASFPDVKRPRPCVDHPHHL